MRIDGVTTSPGLIVAGKTWTLASAADGFWMVHVGWMVPGERQDTRPTPWSRVDADDLTAVAADKRSRFIPWRKIRSAHIRDHTTRSGDSFPVVRLRGPFVRRLEFRNSDRATVEVFFEPIADRIS
jgi:hypothetical protein